MRRTMLLRAGWVTSMATMAHAAGEPAAPKDDFSWMRGANYVQVRRFVLIESGLWIPSIESRYSSLSKAILIQSN